MEFHSSLLSVSGCTKFIVNKGCVIVGCIIGTGISYCIVRWYFAGGRCNCTNRLDGKTVIITGSNTGIGKETARNLASRGARVILACRDITKGERAAEDIRTSTGNKNVVVQIVDLSSLESVRKFSRQILEKEKRLDILINSAGVMCYPHWTSREGYELHFAVNHLSHFLMTNLLVALMKKSAPSRIICVTCNSYEGGNINFEDLNSQKTYDPWKAYNQSKLANILFSQELSERLEGSCVTVNSVHPGIIKSEIFNYKEDMRIPWWRRLLLKILATLIMKTPVQGAQTSIHCSLADDLKYISGQYFSDCEMRETTSITKDKDVQKELWDVSCKLVNLHIPPS